MRTSIERTDHRTKSARVEQLQWNIEHALGFDCLHIAASFNINLTIQLDYCAGLTGCCEWKWYSEHCYLNDSVFFGNSMKPIRFHEKHELNISAQHNISNTRHNVYNWIIYNSNKRYCWCFSTANNKQIEMDFVDFVEAGETREQQGICSFCFTIAELCTFSNLFENSSFLKFFFNPSSNR